MPNKYIDEMLCDWLGAGRAQGTNPYGKYSVALDYYIKNKDRMHFTDKTRSYLEENLNRK